MAVEAHLVGKEQFVGIACMGIVAARAHAAHDRHVNRLLSGKRTPVMAEKA
jgi:hypothetical protein